MPPKKSPSKRSAVKGKPETLEAAAAVAGLSEHSTLSGTPEVPPPDDEVARRAYSLWESRGKPLGSPDEDWYRAMQELRTAGNSGSAK